MPISTITTNYSGRVKDIFISQGINPAKGEVQPVTYSFGKVSAYVTGVQKLIQRYLISLLNTELITQLRSARASNVQEATHLFNLASWSVIQAFRKYQIEHPDIPADEQLATVLLQDLTVVKDAMRIYILLITKAGEKVDFILPLSF